jgi:YjbE family integral membrane protein
MSSTFDFIIGVVKIVVIDLALAGDNALVIALAVRTLPARQRFLGRVWGAAGAVLLRVAFIAIVSYLLVIPMLQVVGGLLLVWIAIKLVRQSDGPTPGHVRQGTTLGEAIWIIIVADVVMSLDNVIGVAGAAEGICGSSSSASRCQFRSWCGAAASLPFS